MQRNTIRMKGKTYEEIYGPEKARKIKAKQSRALVGNSRKKGHKCSQEFKRDRRERMLGNNFGHANKGQEAPWNEYNLGMLGKKHSKETKRKISKALKGRKRTDATRIKISISHGGDGNIERMNANHNYRDRDLKWAKKIYKRDGYTCQFCLERNQNGRINAHHIFPKLLFPKLRYKIDNGVTLCKRCHGRIKGLEMEMIRWFQIVCKLADF